MRTRAPALASDCVVARPIPREAPVTSAVLLAKSNMITPFGCHCWVSNQENLKGFFVRFSLRVKDANAFLVQDVTPPRHCNPTGRQLKRDGPDLWTHSACPNKWRRCLRQRKRGIEWRGIVREVKVRSAIH